MSKSSRHTAGVLYNLNNNRMNVICSVLAILGMMGMVGMVGCSLADPCEKGEIKIDDECKPCHEVVLYHLNNKGKCVPDTLEECGSPTNNCEQIEGKNEVGCEYGKCRISSCAKGYEKVEIRGENDYCRPSTEEACGDKKTNCYKIKGMKNVGCVDGKCVIKECEEGYELNDNSCVPIELYHCGEEKNINCVEVFKKLYSNEKYKNIAVPSCSNDKQCIISDCKEFVDENEEIHDSVLISCEQYEQYQSSYDEEGKAFMQMCEDSENKEFKFCLPYQCPRADAGQVQKVVQGECGCGKPEDTEDSDGDGVMNCKDVCPNNHTKTTVKGEGGCEIRDTDGDGVDDSADFCPTRKEKQSFTDITEDELKNHGLCGNNGCPKSADELDELGIAKLCGIYKERSDKMPEVHIYNALDFETLRIVLNNINKRLFCTTNDSSKCSKSKGNVGRKCVNGIYYSYNYYDSNDGTKNITAATNCFNDLNDKTTIKPLEEAVIPVEFAQLKVILEDNINLNDDNDTIPGKNECYGIWSNIPYMIGVEFDGKGKTIKYYPNDDKSEKLRCDLMNSLFGEIILSNVHNLTLEFGVKGYGRGLLAHKISSSSLSNINIVDGKVETTVIGDDGVGLLAGSYDMSKSFPPKISIFTSESKLPVIENITAHNVSVIAPYANRVGGLFGQLNAKNINLLIDDYTVDQIQGNDYVGGVIGHADGAVFNEIQIYCDNSSEKINSCINLVEGKNNVGGVIGGLNNSVYENMNVGCQVIDIDNKYCINSVSGSNHVGGVIGSFVGPGYSSSNLPSTTIRNIHEVSGENYIGGFAGYVSDVTIKSFDLKNIEKVTGTKNYVGGVFGVVAPTTVIGKENEALRVSSDTISGNDYVGGVVGHCQYCNLNGFVFAQTGRIKGNMGVGGIYGVYDYLTHAPPTFSHMYNVVGTISGNDGVGGIVGSVNSDSNAVTVSNLYNHVLEINKGDGDSKKFGGILGEIALAENIFSSNQLLNISFDTVYNHIESFSPGECAGGLIGNMHEMANDSNIFKKAYINMEKLHTEIDTYTVSYPKGGINGGILSRIESNTVSATSASFFINYLLDSYATDVFGALFQDENTTSYSGFHSTHFGAAFSVKRTGGDLTDCEAQLPFCSESGLNLKTICDNLSNPENNFCKYYMKTGNGLSWDKSKFKLGDKEQTIPSMSKQVMDALTSAGVIPNTSK